MYMFASRELPLTRRDPYPTRRIPNVGSFGLDELPPGAVATLRSLEITPTGITIGMGIGAFGDGLSTFIP